GADLPRQVLPQAGRGVSSRSPRTTVGAPVPPPPPARAPPSHPLTPTLGASARHHGRCRTPLRPPTPAAVLRRPPALEVTGPCSRWSPIPGEVILAAMNLSHPFAIDAPMAEAQRV